MLHHLDKAFSHSHGERLDEDLDVWVEVLDTDGPHEASLLLFFKITEPSQRFCSVMQATHVRVW